MSKTSEKKIASLERRIILLGSAVRKGMRARGEISKLECEIMRLCPHTSVEMVKFGDTIHWEIKPVARCKLCGYWPVKAVTK